MESLLRKLKNKEHFTSKESRLADFILSDVRNATTITEKQLSAQVNISRATISRFLRKLNFVSFQQFIGALGNEYEVLCKNRAMLARDPVHEGDTISDLIAKIPCMYQRALDNTRSTLDEKVINSVVEKIRCSSIVEIYGTGIAAAEARIFAFKLNSIGIVSMYEDGPSDHAMASFDERPDKVAVVISLSGGNPNMVRLAKCLRQHKYYTIGIGGTMMDDLQKSSDAYIAINEGVNFIAMEMLTTLTSVNYIFDIIFSSLIARNFKNNKETSMRVIYDDQNYFYQYREEREKRRNNYQK